MTSTFLPATGAVAELFAAEIGELGGTVMDRYEDGQRLYARAVLGVREAVRGDDWMRNGIALRVTKDVIAVHPYTFREICTNGAIEARAIESRLISRLETPASDTAVAVALLETQLAIRACASPEIFRRSMRLVRSAAETSADVMLHLIPLLSVLPEQIASHARGIILARFEEGDRSLFALMNAVTSVARDAEDREARWRLEELGGAMPALLRPTPRVRPPMSQRLPETAGV